MKKMLSFLLAFILLLSPGLSVLAEEAGAMHGFKLIREEEVADISATAMIYEHEATGAELIWLKNDDPFKVFAATFRTEPWDSTGSPHIIEHALLGGSRKYQSNDLFTDMNAISTNAYMNAMTYADKTIFPVASRDPQDFANLTDVYLDSVFFANIKEDKSVLDQEGWHYEIFDKEDPITINGVVYNEMRGADSNPMRLLYQNILTSLYPDTIYANNSGGSPDTIPDLSYENFLKFYNTYYHPSNVMFYFYGDVDIDYYLQHINDEYLSQFERQEVDVRYAKQEPFSEPRELTSVYNIGANEDPSGKTYLSWNVTCGDGGNVMDYYMLNIIADVMADANYAPIKNALFDKDIGEDNGSFYLQFNTNSFGVVAINAEEEQKDEFVSTIKECLQSAVDEGIDPTVLESSINSLEMAVREASSNDGLKGMDYMDLILDSKNYGGDPLAYLHFTDIFTKLREGIADGAYEKFIQERLLDNPHQSVVVLKPEPGLTEKKAAETEAKLDAYKKSLSEEELQALIDENVANEAKKGARGESSLPRLKLEEIDTNIFEINYDVNDFDGTKVLYSVQPSNGIMYLDMQFDLSTVDVDKVPYAVLLSNLLTSLDTENYSYGDLEKEIYLVSGGINFDISNAEHTKTHELDARFSVSGKSTAENFPRMLELINEIIFTTKFEDVEWISQQITQMKSGMEMSAQSEGLSLGLTRVRSYFSPMFKYREMLSGVDHLRFLQDLETRFAENPDEVIAELQAVGKQIFNRKGLVVGFVADEADYPAFEESFKPFLDKLPNEDLENKKFDLEVGKLNEGFATNADVNYVIAAGDLKKVVDEINGSAKLLTNILDNYYLYTELRQKGGAYGGGSILDNYGNLIFYSYRDPKLRETLEVYRNAGKFLSEFEISDEDLEGQIIGYFKAYPTTPASVANNICYREINGLTNEDYLKEAEAVVATTAETIQSFGKLLDEVMKQDYICAFAKRSMVNEQSDLFNSIEEIVPGQASDEEETAETEMETYVVAEGDTLESILTGKYTQEQLTDALLTQFITANAANINEDGTVEVGTELKLPVLSDAEAPAEEEAETVTEAATEAETEAEAVTEAATEAETEAETEAAAAIEKLPEIKVGLCTDTGGVDDKSFNQGTWEGIVRYMKDQELGDEFYQYVQATSDADYIPQLTTYAEMGLDLIVAPGFLFKDAITQVAGDFPEQNFLFIDDISEAGNVLSATFAEHEGSFLVGVAAALKAEEAGKNKVGFVGGMDFETIQKFEAGYEQGVHAVNPDIEVVIEYVGAFDRPEDAQAIATKMYDSGCYVIYHAAGGSGNGVIKEAKDRAGNGEDVWVIGVDKDQYEEGIYEDGKSVILTSMVKRVDAASYIICQEVARGEFKGGHRTFALKDGGVDVPEENPNLNEEWLKTIEEYKQQIIGGELEVSPVPARLAE